MAVDSSGIAYLTGGTTGGSFPTTLNAYTPAISGTFVVKLNPALSGSAGLLYSTILARSVGYDIALDASNEVYVTGLARSGYPTKNALQGTLGGSTDAFIAKLDMTLSGTNSLIYSTYLGGSGEEYGGRSIAVDGAGNPAIVGTTGSTDLITTTGAFQPANHGGAEGFLIKLNVAGNARILSTYLGGSATDEPWAVAMDPAGNMYVTGYTESNNFPQAFPVQAPGGSTDAFVTAFPSNGQGVIYSTQIGGNDVDDGWGITVNAQGSVYITGQTYSANFPLAYPVQATYSADAELEAIVVRLSAANRVIHYQYDALHRLIQATEQPGAAYRYSYDDAGNRTGVWLNGTRTLTQTHDAANQVSGWSYDNAGNLIGDGTTTYAYDALSRTTGITMTGQTRLNSYTGDGVLLKQIANGTTTRYIQDLASPLSQVLQTTGPATTNHIYGLERLASKTSSTRSWYLADALGSVRRTLDNNGAAASPLFYDPWGGLESGGVPTFGFTGELHDPATGMVNLRARWYSTSKGTFTSKDPFEGYAEQPYSLHPYQYAYANPVLLTDHTGYCSAIGDDYCYPINTWQEFEAAYPYDYRQPVANTPGAQQWNVHDAVSFADAYERFWSDPIKHMADIGPTNTVLIRATVFAEYFLGRSLTADDRVDPLFIELSELQGQRDLTDEEQCAFLFLAMAFGARQYEPDRGGGGGSNVKVYSNTLPDELVSELATARRLKITPIRGTGRDFEQVVNAGTIKWAVTAEGDLVIVPKHVNEQEIAHTVLTGGRSVRAAGEAEIAGTQGNYIGISINNHSGHYQPSVDSIEIGKTAFMKIGIHFP